MRGATDVASYTLNVQPDETHELTDGQAADLRALGFQVTPVEAADVDAPDGEEAEDGQAIGDASSPAVTTRKAATGRTSTTEKEGA